MMRFLLFVFIVISGFTGAFAKDLAQEQFQKANRAYDSSDYNMAIQLYESLVKDQFLSADLHFNLGNAYFKSNDIPMAILNYEKTLKINPGHKDAAYNLELANAKTIDQIEGIPDLFLYRWWRSIFNLFSSEGWAYLCVALFIIALILASFYFFLSILSLRKIGFYGGITALILAAFSWFMAQQQEAYLNDLSHAIIVEPTININSSPSEGSSKLFVLHEGTKVRVKESKDDWYKIAIPNGNEGWVRSQFLEGI